MVIIILSFKHWKNVLIRNYNFGDQLVDILENKIFKNSLVQPAGRMWPFLILLVV